MAVKKKYKNESFESMMKRFKKNVEKRDLINEVKKREHYIKSSTRNKLAKEIAKKREKRRQEDQNLNRSA
jgi:small subunit ribosomal protein S21|tara:strand:+ start:1750 stop:1959 length:210 start_codon:yes stop_codon:yes gene_type:complete